MTKCKRVFILGIDGASWNVLDPQLAAGRMPCLQSWLDRGVRADLESVIPPVTPAAWSSFHTGKHPGKHGVMVTPSVVIDDQIVADGKLPDRQKLKDYLAGQLGG